MAQNLDYTLIDFKAIRETVKKSKGTEEEPFEGDVPIEESEAAISKVVKGAKGKLVFDGMIHADGTQYVAFLKQFGLPSFVLCLTAGKNPEEDQKEIQARWSKLNEDAECGEEQVAALKEDAEKY